MPKFLDGKQIKEMQNMCYSSRVQTNMAPQSFYLLYFFKVLHQYLILCLSFMRQKNCSTFLQIFNLSLPYR